MTQIIQALAHAALVWGFFVIGVHLIGIYKIFRYHSSVTARPVSSDLPVEEVPHVTILRPAKGLEPSLYECLASTFYQDYPKDKLTINFCVASGDDAAYPVIRSLLDDFPGFDARVLLESEDPFLQGATGTGGNSERLGPNPKIRNLSRGYREAKGDIIWVVDCNVWVSRGAAGRMVDRLCGFSPDGRRRKPCKFVHQLPLVVDTVSSMMHAFKESEGLLSGSDETATRHDLFTTILRQGGGRLEEMFIATTHAKLYSAINAVGLVPCIVGKSNMYRKSHLQRVTPAGLDHLSVYICEDQLIGDMLWKSDIPGFDDNALVWGDLAVQPMAGMSIAGYVARRVRWLRVRKWAVTLATFIEPGVEPFVCCFFLSFGLTTVPWFAETVGIPQTWAMLGRLWCLAVAAWMLVDRLVYKRLHSGYSLELDVNTPSFARGTERGGAEKRAFAEWLLAWVAREALALPIWTWAVLLGDTVTWRGKKLRIRSDMSVVPVEEARKGRSHKQE